MKREMKEIGKRGFLWEKSRRRRKIRKEKRRSRKKEKDSPQKSFYMAYVIDRKETIFISNCPF